MLSAVEVHGCTWILTNAGKQQILNFAPRKSVYVHMCINNVNLVNTFKHITLGYYFLLPVLLPILLLVSFCLVPTLFHGTHITLGCIVICLLCYICFSMFSQALCLHMHVFYVPWFTLIVHVLNICV